MFRSPQGQICDFEWKRGVWNLTQISCEGLEERVSFVGSYDDYECAVLVEDADEADNGFWSCEVESYVLGGGRGSGWTLNGDISINVILPTTTSTTTTATTTNSIPSLLPKGPQFPWKPSDSNLSADILPSTQIATNMELARMVPFSVSVFVIIVFIVLFTILVVVHKKKTVAALRTLMCKTMKPSWSSLKK